MIAIIDYGMGNLRSVEKALESLGADLVVTSDPDVVRQAAGVILPGVGAFGDAMENLRQQGMISAIQDVVAAGKPFLGICLGMQLLFTSSDEHGFNEGLNLIEGHVRRFQGDFKIPHIGWNDLTLTRESALLDGVQNGDYVYWVHSLVVEPVDRDVLLATTDYYGEVPGIVGRDHVFGIQFHPEKSSRVGLTLLRNFVGMVREGVRA
ncbi:imidazole glycerol phosphate synthase subunit HisH [Tumebacillus permanentifrigoris]|uniref:Imidazole glycerol phosphate synthase subunit HisH n=1 Tax=Tumebacillus permanentifrigoris TaxID=378543 RepID=A0A316D917_9BACL|nr:imidazole glycerol phosphate synthase subunit HisH [Tumebacillus permanentifrigoris]PWK13010.1 glutamine amidotransferase [Tumebacillus permanentifrigoris]